MRGGITRCLDLLGSSDYRREQPIPIKTPQDLHEHIELAIKIEMSTIPPYLFAMYSIEDQTSEPALLLRSIVAEEMLHAALASNLLLAVGGQPSFSSTAYFPTYPSELPHHTPPLVVELKPCSGVVIESVFMRIEQPEIHGAPAQPDEFETLGQFYHALEIGLREVSATHPIFADAHRSAQMSDPAFYRPVQFDAEDSGGLMLIQDLDSAIEAIEIIVHQGEGLSDERWADPAHQELTHYHKLLQIKDGTSPLGSVRPLRPNPKTAGFPEQIRPLSDLFNASYRYVLLIMQDIFSDGPGQPEAVGHLYQAMVSVLSPLALHLVQQPAGNGEYAAPTFELYEFDTAEPGAELVQLASSALAGLPELADVEESISAIVS